MLQMHAVVGDGVSCSCWAAQARCVLNHGLLRMTINLKKSFFCC